MDAASPPPPAAEEREPLSLGEIRDVWPLLAHGDRIAGFLLLPRDEAEDFFFGLSARDQSDLVCGMPGREQRSWVRLLPPDDAADLVQAAPTEKRDQLLALLDEPTRREVTALLAYSEDNAGGLMNPRYIRLRPEMTVDEAISYVRKQMREQPRTIYYGYVLDSEQRLLGVVSFRELFTASVRTRVAEIMKRQVTTIPEQMDQETVSHKFAQSHLVALPVVSTEGQMKGIVTVDDVVDVVQEEATEDMQKMGGVEALDAPYLQIELRKMIRKRVGWLSVLFLGEMLTASAMGFFEKEIARAVVLALFIPLIISSGGNSGSQATTLVIRAMALGEVRLRDWFRVIRREVVAGCGLGLVLAAIGFIRIVTWEGLFHTYGPQYLSVATTVACSLVGVVLWGTMAGSMLPFVLRRFGFDPASASAPFVATLVDVSGLVIYFTVAAIVLRGRLL
ncbi:MAG TPA: magnesium transporter [Polyangia bacterium]|jgi:magnesium transporter|nr:magnesium transporter [Polyangia bacterium]